MVETKELILAVLGQTEDDPQEVYCWYSVSEGKDLNHCPVDDLPEGELGFLLAIGTRYSYELILLPDDTCVKAVPRSEIRLEIGLF